MMKYGFGLAPDMTELQKRMENIEEVKRKIRELRCDPHGEKITMISPELGRMCDTCWKETRMLQLVQKGEGETTDLFVWCMGNLQPELRLGAPKDTIVYFFNGAGTSKYENPPSSEQIKKLYPGNYKTVTWGGWSAGGRACQAELNRCYDKALPWPNAVIIADGLYAPSHADGSTDMSKMRGMVAFALHAASAKGGDPVRCVLWHSNIPTPGYESSKECIEEIQKRVEDALGVKMREITGDSLRELESKLDGRKITQALWLGHLTIIEYAGRGKAEHIAEAHMIDEVMRTFIPWFTDDNRMLTQEPGLYLVKAEGARIITEGIPAVYFPEMCSEDTAWLGCAPFTRILLDKAKALVGTKETSHNSGPVIDEMLKLVDRPPNSNWCAAAFWYVFYSALADWESPPLGDVEGTQLQYNEREDIWHLGVPTAGAKATMVRFQKAKRWIPASKLRANPKLLQVGMIPVWDRTPAGKPINSSWEGHIGAGIFWVGENGEFTPYEGNSGPDGDEFSDAMRRSIHDPRFLGVGVL